MTQKKKVQAIITTNLKLKFKLKSNTVSCFYSWLSITVQWFIYMATFFNAISLRLPALVTLSTFKSSCLKITTYSATVHYVLFSFLQEIIKIPESLANEHPARSQKKWWMQLWHHLLYLWWILFVNVKIKQCCWAQHRTRTAYTLVHQLLCTIREEHSLSHLENQQPCNNFFRSPPKRMWVTNSEVHTIQRMTEKLEFKFLKIFSQKQNQGTLLTNGTIQKRRQPIYSVAAQDTKNTGN